MAVPGSRQQHLQFDVHCAADSQRESDELAIGRVHVEGDLPSASSLSSGSTGCAPSAAT